MSSEKTLEPGVAVASLPAQEICREALLEKYTKGKERTIAEVRSRVARALAAAEAPEKRATWERRDGRTLTVEGYRESGGVASAIARTADSVLASC